MPLKAHCNGFVLKCDSCGEELMKTGHMAPLAEAAAAGWGLIVEPNGMYDYVCSTCLAKSKVDCSQTSELQALRPDV